MQHRHKNAELESLDSGKHRNRASSLSTYRNEMAALSRRAKRSTLGYGLDYILVNYASNSVNFCVRNKYFDEGTNFKFLGCFVFDKPHRTECR